MIRQVFIASVLCAVASTSTAHAQDSGDAVAAIESVFGAALSSGSASPSAERAARGQRVYAYSGNRMSATTIGAAPGLAAAGQAEIAMASADWTKVRKALIRDLGPADTRRGNQVLVWEVPESGAAFADTMSVVLSKSGSNSVLYLERRRPVRDVIAEPVAPQGRNASPYASGLPAQPVGDN